MPKASEHQSGDLTKMLLIGPSGSGKSGALLSLAKAGYKLRIIDMDNGLDYLMRQLRKPANADAQANVEYVSIQDKLKANASLGIQSVGVPNGYTRAVMLMDKWEDGSIPAQWGKDYILVLDSLTFFANAAYRWKEALNPTAKDPRQIFYAAQEATEDVLALMTSAEMKCNVIVTSHIKWLELGDGTTKAFPSSIGGALGPKIPTYFNTLVLAESIGTGEATRRQIRTAPSQFMDLKNPAEISAPLPIETGLADFFKAAQA